jgi:hypothetical protein
MASRYGYVWLLAVTAVFVLYTIDLRANPEEAIHFIQYGLLGILVYRALTHRVRDVSIYFAAAMIGGIVGMIDEAIQWLVPRRFWGLHDIWLNFFAASLGIAKGLSPPIILGRPNRVNLRFLLRVAMVAVVLLGVGLMNTPARIHWYTERLPWLEFLERNESVMMEYGYLIEDEDTGIFRSRFSPAELRRTDRQRASEAAEILDRFRDRTTYEEFLRVYNPISDAFVHEARVHLYSRDVHASASAKNPDDPREFAEHLTVAFRENRIMEEYFTNTLRQSDYLWSEEQAALAQKHVLPDYRRKSWVSRHLITRFREGHVALFFGSLLTGLIILDWYLGRNKLAPSSS